MKLTLNGTSYSLYPKGWDIRPASEFIANNAQFREGVGMVLRLSNEQEAYIENYLRSYDESYNWFSDKSCGDPIENALEYLGYEMGVIVFPVGLGNTLMRKNMVESYNFYVPTQPDPDWWRSAPWGNSWTRELKGLARQLWWFLRLPR